jgi:hypothetical protein
MKALSLTILLVASLAFVLMGCSDNFAPIVAPGEQPSVQASAPTSLTKAGTPNSLVTGNGTFSAPWCPFITFEFSLIKMKDGSVQGHSRMAYLNAEKKVQDEFGGAIKGAKFDRNVVMFYVEIEGAMFEEYWGSHLGWKQIFVVTDNGEGAKSTPDRMSNPWLTTDEVPGWEGEFDAHWALDADQFLASIPPAWGGPDYPLLRGNIQVCVK